MTKAVCFKCGEFKRGAFNPCGACGVEPQDDEELILSLAMTDHYFDEVSLSQFGERVKAGDPPKLDEGTRADLLNAIEEFKRTPAGRLTLGRETGEKAEAKPKQKWWWPF